MSLVIDSHQHFWDRRKVEFDYSWQESEALGPIRRNYLPSDLKPLIDGVGVDRAVFVQTQHKVEENDWVLGMAEEHDWICGMVGWVDLRSEACEEQLARYKDHPKFVGIRHVTHDEPDVDWVVHEDTLRGLKVLEKHGVPFDALFFVEHLHHIKRLAEECEGLKIVVDHLAKPHIKDGRTDNWIENFKTAARYEGVYCKLSGMVTEADWESWKAADLKPYVQAALELFGPERCMFGSDWPVCELAGRYGEVYEALVEALGPISEDERARIFGGTAIEFYGLQV